MTTLWADGFEDSDNTSAGMTLDYAISGTPSDATGRRTGTKAVNLNSSSAYLQRTMGSSGATMFQSFACKSQGVNDNFNLAYFNEGATIHVNIGMDSAGKLKVGRNSVLLGTSSAQVFFANQWVWLQIKVVIHDTTGSVEVRDASGAVIINLTNVDTRNGGTGVVDNCRVGANTNAGYAVDDWHIWDTTGSICNTWTNDTRIDSIRPDGAGASTQFTPSVAPNWDAVNEAQWNSTDYVESSTAAHQDLYTFSDLSHSPVSIFGVLRAAVAQKDDAGARSLKLLTRRSATTYAGSAQALTQGSYGRVYDVQEADPSTSAAWTKTNLNAAEFGIENV